MRPVLLGYQTARPGTPPAVVARGRDELAAFAHREGFALDEVFVEDDASRPTSALGELIAAARHRQARAVAVPTSEDLGRLERVRWLVRRRLEREAGVEVLVVRPLRGAAR